MNTTKSPCLALASLRLGSREVKYNSLPKEKQQFILTNFYGVLHFRQNLACWDVESSSCTWLWWYTVCCPRQLWCLVLRLFLPSSSVYSLDNWCYLLLTDETPSSGRHNSICTFLTTAEVHTATTYLFKTSLIVQTNVSAIDVKIYRDQLYLFSCHKPTSYLGEDLHMVRLWDSCSEA